MSKILRLAGNTQGYLYISRDAVQDTYDIRKWRYNYVNQPTVVEFPTALAYWKLEEASGTRADSSGNGRDLALVTGATDPGNTVAKLANGVLFPANSSATDYALRNSDINLGGLWTIAFWFKGVDIVTYGWTLIEMSLRKLTSPWTDFLGIDIYPQNDGTANFYITKSGTALDETFVLDCTTMHFVCIYYDGTGVYLEVDNVEKGSVIESSGIADEAARFTLSGAYSNLKGCADELGIWAVALTSDQRAQLWNSGAGWSPY